ncbi:hypothetical protein CGZ75_03000 [Paenibacillus herberti]|uniref:Uncharacterized protein n=1 Tax=Paenibacillus herberti TaxID=1619309 RepID=A0A229P1D9_9BACL|nr:hypothetical protein CGZ75_03000 [Paenibacillus herberti]
MGWYGLILPQLGKKNLPAELLSKEIGGRYKPRGSRPAVADMNMYGSASATRRCQRTWFTLRAGQKLLPDDGL